MRLALPLTLARLLLYQNGGGHNKQRLFAGVELGVVVDRFDRHQGFSAIGGNHHDRVASLCCGQCLLLPWIELVG